jgi:uncharacterized membrane protein (UPF0127 family)
VNVSSLLEGLFKRRAALVRAAVTNETRGTVLASEAEVAGDAGSRRRGLLKHKGLQPGQGLWIVPCSAVHSFGMRFDIDLVYLDRKHRVRKVQSVWRPGRMSMCLGAHSVLELPSGTVERTATRTNDQLAIVLSNTGTAVLP